jgi:hypothetical protein
MTCIEDRRDRGQGGIDCVRVGFGSTLNKG